MPDTTTNIVRSQFLEDLITEFGTEYGVALYQAETVNEEDLENFIALRNKFQVEVRQQILQTNYYTAAFVNP